MKTNRRVFIGLKDIANIPMTFKKAFEENGIRCDYYAWSDLKNNGFGYRKDKLFFQFKRPPPFRIFGKNPFWLLSKLLAVIYLLYSILRYDYFFFISPKTFLSNNKDFKLIRLFKKKVIMIFTGCTERDFMTCLLLRHVLTPENLPLRGGHRSIRSHSNSGPISSLFPP